MEVGNTPPIELILFNIILLCILYIQIYDLFSDHVAESKGKDWLPSFRASPVLPPPPILWDKTIIMLDILHKLKIFFCDDDVEKIYVRDSTVIRNNEIHRMYNEILYELGDLAGDMIKDVMERDMINEISTLFVMIFMSGLMFVMPMLDIECDDIAIIIGSGIILSFILTIIPILLSYDIRDEIIELIEDMDSQIVVDTSLYKTNLP